MCETLAGLNHLHINWITFMQSCFKLGDGVIRVPFEDVKMTNAIFAEERSGHGTVKSMHGVNDHRDGVG